jgi:hypothetical protein
LLNEDVCRQADAQGIGDPFRRILQSATAHGLYPRPYQGSVMYAPPTQRTRALFTVRNWVQHPGMLTMRVGPEAFAEFFPVSQAVAEECLGSGGWRSIPAGQVDEFIQGLARWFSRTEPAPGSDVQT